MNPIIERLKQRFPDVVVLAGIAGAIYIAFGGREVTPPDIAVPPATRYSSDGRPVFVGPEAPPRRWPWEDITGDENHRTNARCPHCKYPMQLRSAKGRIVCKGCGEAMAAQAAVNAIN